VFLASGAAVILVCILILMAMTPPRYPANVAASEKNAERIRDSIEANSGGPGGGGEVLADPNGWATITGTFKVNGQVPRGVVNGEKDWEVCAPGGQKPLSEEAVVGSNGELSNVLIYMTTKTDPENELWEHPSYAANRAGELEFDQKACVFMTHVFAMRSTQKLKILNSDPVGHNAKISPDRGANQFNETIPPNQFAMYDPGGESPGAFTVECTIHPWMRAYMITRDNPYFAVTDKDGKFEIANVPAGVELEFRVWHEMPGNLKQVNLNGADTTWKKGYFKENLEAGSTKDMQVVLSNSLFGG
jgi:hypothetical protein